MHTYVHVVQVQMSPFCVKQDSSETKSTMKNPAVRPVVANTSVRMQRVGDNRQRIRPVLFVSGRGVACLYAVCV